jgi:flavin reductase (DIM6/NTAB) family NADH-FMN oxidoreductase RutF
MYFNLSELDGRNTYKLMTSTIVPRPIAWVVSQDAAGRRNAAPFSFFGLMSGDPPLICIGVGARDGRAKDTGVNLRGGGEFVVNLVSHELLDAMNVTAIDFGPEVDELEAAQLETAPSVHVAPPRIAASPVSFECRVANVIEIAPERWLILGTPLAVHVRDDAVINKESCYIDSNLLDLVGRMRGGKGGGYSTQRHLVEVPSLTEAQWRASRSAP